MRCSRCATHQLLLSICPNDVKAAVKGRSILLNLKLCLAVSSSLWATFWELEQILGWSQQGGT